jgi:drug/metabolite transporter (DMT)-like permease
MSEQHDIWFPAKTHGWGWGPPVKWQGWLVLALYVGGIAAAAIRLSPDTHPAAFALVVSAMTGILIAICYARGEKPGWRWGRK